jgi:hypothetical protein
MKYCTENSLFKGSEKKNISFDTSYNITADISRSIAHGSQVLLGHPRSFLRYFTSYY